MSNVSKEQPAAAWELEMARLIAFPAESALSLAHTWWKEIVADQPEDYVLTQTRHSHQERGAFQNVALFLNVNHNQIEWLIQPLSEFDEAAEAFLTVGPFREKVRWFIDLMNPWLAKASLSLQRLAFAGKLLQPAATQEEAYQILAHHLPGVRLEPRPNDFLYNVNRRRNSKVITGLPINRVSTWSKMNTPFMASLGVPFQWPERCYSALQLDMNTAPEIAKSLPASLVPRLFEELASLAVEIAERGDVE